MNALRNIEGPVHGAERCHPYHVLRFSEVHMNRLTHIPALASAFLGGALLYLSIYLPIESNIFAALLAGAGTMAIAYSYGSLRQMTR